MPLSPPCGGVRIPSARNELGTRNARIYIASNAVLNEFIADEQAFV